MNLPDLRRARQVWLTPPRLVVGGVLATAVGACAALLCVGNDSGQLLTGWILTLQNMVLFFYGVPSAVNDFVEEHQNNTWDMLRLTPLTAAEMVLGRLLASTSYAVFLAAALAPWALFALPLPRAPGLLPLLAQWAAMGLGFAAASATGIAAAALAARIQAGRVGNAGLAMGGLGFIASGYTQVLAVSTGTVPLVVGPVPAFLYFAAALGLWTAWSASAAVRLVGRLLSEPQSRWALPGFLATLWAYLALWVPGGRTAEAWECLCITVPAVVTLLASFAEGEGPEEWRTGLRLAAKKRSWRPLVPGWAAPWLTVAGLAGLTLALRPELARIAALVAIFLARDLFVLGTLRVALRKNVEVAGMVVLGSLYILPVLTLASTSNIGALYWLVPMQSETAGFLANILPGALQALAAAGLFGWRVRTLGRSEKLLP
ncbi:hypothetical protein EPO15_15675 [bacterium]|nr:MAG: hypothetical protein EPO15_15675 [bacterium]